MEAVADGAVVAIDLRAGRERRLIGLDGRRLDHFPVDAGVKWNTDDEALVGKRMVARPQPEVGRSGTTP